MSAASVRTRRREGGFTLVEVMIAIVILTVGLLSLAQMMVLATSSNQLSGRMTSSANTAKEQLERLKAIPFYTDPIARVRSPELQDGQYTRYFDPDGLPEDHPDYGGPFLEVNWEISTVQTGMPLEMVLIELECVPAGGEFDQFTFIGDARFTTYRTANTS